MNFTSLELSLVALFFCWSGFVRTGLGFGGAALGLPLMMLVGGSPIDWLPTSLEAVLRQRHQNLNLF
jgi:hypothetical protein